MAKEEIPPKYYRAQKELRSKTWKALEEYKMVEEGDRVMVCLSGGKDSYTMLDMMIHFSKYSDVKFEVVAVNLDQKQPGFPEEVLPTYLSQLGVPFKIVEQDTYSVVKEKTPRRENHLFSLFKNETWSTLCYC